MIEVKKTPPIGSKSPIEITQIDMGYEDVMMINGLIGDRAVVIMSNCKKEDRPKVIENIDDIPDIKLMVFFDNFTSINTLYEQIKKLRNSELQRLSKDKRVRKSLKNNT